MRVKKEILDLVNNPVTRTQIAAGLGCGEQVLYRHIKDNEDNGRLTKMDALKAISEVTGIEVLEILTEDVATVTQS